MPKTKNKKTFNSDNYTPKYQLISSTDEYFDDCPVCRLMKKAEKEGRSPTKEELEEAMLKANTQN